jgi:hypothetical protein
VTEVEERYERERREGDEREKREWSEHVRQILREGVDSHLRGIFLSGAAPTLFISILIAAGASRLHSALLALQSNTR